MKRKDLDDLKTKSTGDLEKKIKDLWKEKTNALLELKMGKLKDTHKVKGLRQDLAQVYTVMRLKQLASVEEVKPPEAGEK